MITVIAFHVDGEQKIKSAGGAMLGMLAKSARKAMPDCRLVLMTDSDAPDGWEKNEFLPYRDIKISRMQAFARAALEYKAPLLFVDTDVMINKDVSGLFDGDIKLHTTGQNVNAGVIYVQTPLAARALFKAVIGMYETIPEHITRGWGTDGVMTRVLYGKGKPVPETEWSGWDIRCEPAGNGHWVPEMEHLPYGPEARGANVWHFKGARKCRMPDFYRYLMA